MTQTSAVAGRRRRAQLLGWLLGGALLVALIAQGRITEDQIIAYFCVVGSVLVAGAFESVVLRRSGAPAPTLLSRIDLVGTVLVPAGLLLGGIGYFGWLTRDERVAIVAPSRRLLAAAAAPFTASLVVLGADLGFHVAAGSASAASLPFTARLCFWLGLTNVWLFVVNLLPVPPLLGSLVVERFLPTRAWPRYLTLRPYLGLIAGGLVLADVSFGLGFLTVIQTWLGSGWLRMLGVSS